LWRAAGAVIADGQLNKRASNAVWGFLDLLERLERDIGQLPLHEQVDHVVQVSGLIEHFRKQKLDRGEAKVENLEELVSAARGFVSDPDSDLPPLVDFLAHAALEAGETQAAAYEDCVQLMTLHSAKGLEFKLVFLCGLEEGLFPHQRSISDSQGLEEERRLCYVGLTRAQHQLYLSYAEQRRLYGNDNYATASRFLRELPTELIEEVRPAIQVSRPVYRRESVESAAPGGMDLGRRVRHNKYGEGVVINYEGSGAHARVLVNFETVGTKMLVVAYANLELM
jgi:DNA helicase-2/ATP-dependent DNA helicase PcrA